MSLFTSLITPNITKIIRAKPAKISPTIETTQGPLLGLILLSLKYKMHTRESASGSIVLTRKYASQKSPTVIARKTTAIVFNAITIVCKIELV